MNKLILAPILLIIAGILLVISIPEDTSPPESKPIYMMLKKFKHLWKNKIFP